MESLYKQAAQAFIDGDEELLAQIKAEVERIARRQADLAPVKDDDAEEKKA